jgi:hypothetical protein
MRARRRTSMFRAAALAVALAALTAATAPTAAQAVDPQFTVDQFGLLRPPDASPEISGTFVGEPGFSYEFFFSIEQQVGQRFTFGRADPLPFPVTPEGPVNWSLTASTFDGRFQPGPATVNATLNVCPLLGGECDSFTVTRTVILRPR